MTTLVPCSPALGWLRRDYALVLRAQGVSPLSSAYFAPSGLEKRLSFVEGQGVLPLAGVFRPFRADFIWLIAVNYLFKLIILNKLNI